MLCNNELYNLQRVQTNYPVHYRNDDNVSLENKKYVYINSEDRNIIKYPNKNNFEIELPENITNIKRVRLKNWNFPITMYNFSKLKNNITLGFRINNPYSPYENNYSNTLLQDIYTALFNMKDEIFLITISEGNYSSVQLGQELTNHFNKITTYKIKKFFENNKNNSNFSNNDFINSLNNFDNYSHFIIKYNEIKKCLYFGNNLDRFTLVQTPNNNLLKYLGINDTVESKIDDMTGYINNKYNFYYNENSEWIVNDNNISNSFVSWIEGKQISLINIENIHIEIDRLNFIDETSPYINNNFTQTTNQTNSRVNASFAIIPVPSVNIDSNYNSLYKTYSPPLQSLRKLYFKFRSNNGELVDFGNNVFSFVLEFELK